MIQALSDAGIRAVYGYGPVFYHPNPAANPYPKDIFRLRKQYFSSDDQLLTLAMATRGRVRERAAGRRPSGTSRARSGRASRRTSASAPAARAISSGSRDALAADGQRGLGDDTTYIHACTLTTRSSS